MCFGGRATQHIHTRGSGEEKEREGAAKLFSPGNGVAAEERGKAHGSWRREALGENCLDHLQPESEPAAAEEIPTSSLLQTGLHKHRLYLLCIFKAAFSMETLPAVARTEWFLTGFFINYLITCSWKMFKL